MREKLLLSKKNPPKTLHIKGRLWHLGTADLWGIVNLTPDSFYDGGRLTTDKALCALAEQHLTNGASVLDIGGQSTRPGAAYLDTKAEWRRIGRSIRLLRKTFPQALLSIDTFHAEVARMALEEGAHIINDVSGGGDKADGAHPHDSPMLQLVAKKKVPYVLMHSRGRPQPTHKNTQYTDLMGELWRYFQHRIEALSQLGHADLIIDPGFGFAKTPPQNLYLLKYMALFQALRHPIMVGISRKSMIYKSLRTTPEKALAGTNALHMIALQKGASILRTHDCAEALACIQLFAKLQHSTPNAHE